MKPSDVIVISDSESETASESERLPNEPTMTTSTPPQVEASNPAATSQVMAGSGADGADPVPTSTGSATDKVKPDGVQASFSSLSALIPDRAQLERERRERIRKRKRDQGLSNSSDDEQSSQKQARSSRPPSDSSVPRSTLPGPLPTSSSPLPTPSKRKESRADPITREERFWEGTIKHSYNRYAVPSSQGCSIADMLLPATPSASRGLRQAVLATYDLRMDWLYKHFARDVDVTLILNPGPGDHRSDPSIIGPGLHPTSSFPAFAGNFPGWTICVPRKPKNGWLTQHMKFLFLVHEDFLRVAILSGNLNGFDWDRVENTAFIQDFPTRPSTSPSTSSDSPSKTSENDFKVQLQRVLKSLGMPRGHAIYAALDRFDFSGAAAWIVASWPEGGLLNGWEEIEQQGLGRLGKVVRGLGLAQEKGGVIVEAQGSSLTKYDRKWLEHFHVLASGLDPRSLMPFAGKPNDPHPAYLAATKRKLQSDREQLERDRFDTKGLPPVKILFPSQRYVEQTAVEGPPGAGTFFGKAEAFQASDCKHLYHQPRGQRGDVMIHAKSLLAVLPSHRDVVDRAFLGIQSIPDGGKTLASDSTSRSGTEQEGEAPIGWTYMGSANFTRAAHGNIGGKAGAATLSTSNWELGVVLPILKSEVERDGLDALALRAVTYRRPAEAYERSDAPWNNATLDSLA